MMATAPRAVLIVLLSQLLLLASPALQLVGAAADSITNKPSASSAQQEQGVATAKVQSIPALPGCSNTASSKAGGGSDSIVRSLTPELQHCSWSLQMQRQSSRWYAFEITPEFANNMSVVIMARAVSGQITMALWGPGSDPYRSVPTQVGTNYMEWPGLREVDQEEGQAGGGHASLASEQQYLFLSHRSSKPLLVGQYVVVIQADMGQPLVSVEVSTPSSMTQLVAEEQEALKQLVKACCPGLGAPGSPEALAAGAAAAAGLGSVSSWCSSVGRAVTYDLRQWFADICHVAPNVCSRDGHLQRLMLPPYALRCSSFPTVLSKFPKLRHLDMSYSVAPGSISDVADVVGQLPELQQLHLRGVGLSGPFTCDLLQTARQLQVLSLSDNDKLSGVLPSCWLSHDSLQELQLAGLSDLHGPLPDATRPEGGGGVSSSSQDGGLLCGFGKLKYVNMAGIIGDAEMGLTGTLPEALGFCKELLYLDLSGHSLCGALPALPPGIQFLNVSSNGLSGSLPEFAVDAELQYLDLSFNRFTGTLQDMTFLPSLDWLDLSDNDLTGPMPPLPPSVRWLDLSNNQLSGGVKVPVAPRHGEDSQALVLMNVARNRLTGPLPADLARLPNLAFLDLSHNTLSGNLHAFATALPPTNNILQINLAHNRLDGEVPATLQQLAAVRPVRVTMRDGYTPVTRIFDLSDNNLSGTFPSWLITNVPQLVASCQCSVGVNLDGARFTCPTTPPRITRQAQTILHRFEFLQCTTDDAHLLRAAGGGGGAGAGGAGPQGVDGRQLIPVWVAAAGPGQRPMMTRAEHKQQVLQWHLVSQQDGGQGGAQQHRWQHQHRKGAAIAGAVVGVLAACALAAVAAMVVLKRSRWNMGGGSWRGHLEGGGAAGGYSLLPDYSTYQPAASSPRGSNSGSNSSGGNFTFASYAAPAGGAGGDGMDSPSYTLGSSSSGSGSGSGSPTGHHSPTASSSSGSRTARSSCCGDGVVEIALVLRPSSSVSAASDSDGEGSEGGGEGGERGNAGKDASLKQGKSAGKGGGAGDLL